MSAEFIATMGDGGESYYTFEHDVTRHAAGDVEGIRAKIYCRTKSNEQAD